MIWAEVVHNDWRAEEDVALREQGSPLLRPKINGMAVKPSKPSAEPEKHQERGVLESLGIGKDRNIIIDIPGKRRLTRKEALGDLKWSQTEGPEPKMPGVGTKESPDVTLKRQEQVCQYIGMTKLIDYLCREELPHSPHRAVRLMTGWSSCWSQP